MEFRDSNLKSGAIIINGFIISAFVSSGSQSVVLGILYLV